VRPFRTMTVRLVLVMILLIGSILAACGTSTAHHLSPNEIAKHVGAQYGDPQAQVAMAQSELTMGEPDASRGAAAPVVRRASRSFSHKSCSTTALVLRDGNTPV
jgi:hypothetical protein